MMEIIVNKQKISVDESSLDKKLMDFIREDLNLTGTKNGCDKGLCGTCTILVNNIATKSCIKKVKDVIGKEILTIEGLENPDGTLHPLQQAFIDAGAIQCGFCTPGMVLTAHAFLLKNNNPTRDEIRKAINPVLCRCTGYQQIIDAVELAKDFYKTKQIEH